LCCNFYSARVFLGPFLRRGRDAKAAAIEVHALLCHLCTQLQDSDQDMTQIGQDGGGGIDQCTADQRGKCAASIPLQGQGEWRIMVQIGCRCPPEKQDFFLERVRGFGAREVPAKWHEQLMVVGAEGLAGGSSGRGRKGNGKMRAGAADDGVSSSDEVAARQLKEQEQALERACQESFRVAGSTGSSGGSGSGSESST
jgi:hypothetical protein